MKTATRRIGLDIDGVLANFHEGFHRALVATTGKNLIPEGEEPPCWDYAVEHYGYTKDEARATWNAIRHNSDFWLGLPRMPDAIILLWSLAIVRRTVDVYFITARPNSKYHTEHWIERVGSYAQPTVLMSKDKASVAKGLRLTHFLDDKPETCLAVAAAVPTCQVYLRDARYNRDVDTPGVTRVTSLAAFQEALGLDISIDDVREELSDDTGSH